MNKEIERDLVCDKYEKVFNFLSRLPKRKAYLNEILEYLREYKTVYLLCWCYPKRCHAETVKKWLLDNV
jgi:hypothetical protein